MKDKRLKQLLDEYAAIPRTDRDKDLAKRQDKADVVLSPAPASPIRRRPSWRYAALAASFAIVAAIAIPLAVMLPSNGQDAQVEYAADLAANPNSSGDDATPQSDAPYSEQDPSSSGNGSASGVNHGPNDAPDPNIASVPSDNPSQYIVREDSEGLDWVKDLAQSVYSLSDFSDDNVVIYYNSDNKVITVSDGELKPSGWFSSDERHKLVLCTDGFYGFSAEDFDTVYGNPLHVSLLPLVDGLWYNPQQQEAGCYVVSFAPQNYDYEFVMCAYAGYVGTAYRDDLPCSTTWRDVQVGYSVQNEGEYEICFVKNGMYYCIRTTRQDVDGVGAILDSLFE